LRRRDPLIFKKALRNTLYFKASSIRTTSSILEHHYGTLRCRFSQKFIDGIVGSRMTLWKSNDERRLTISLRKSGSNDIESELDLLFQRDSVDLFVMGVVLVPPCSITATNGKGILVSRVQGLRVGERPMRSATKSLHEISPPYALISAVQGLGQFLDLRTLYGVTAKNQIWSQPEGPHGDFISAYDEFWDSLGLSEQLPGYYVSELPLPEKPILSIRQKHRGRTILKREIKKQISSEVLTALGRMNSPAEEAWAGQG